MAERSRGLLDFPTGPPRSELGREPAPLTIEQLLAAIEPEIGEQAQRRQGRVATDRIRSLFGVPEDQTFLETLLATLGQPSREDWRQDLERLMDEGLLEFARQAPERAFIPQTQPAPAQAIGDFINQLFLGSGTRQQETDQPFVGGPRPQQQAWPPTMDQTVAGLGVGIQPESRQAFSMPAPLPPTGEEVFGDAPEFPTLSRDAVDAFLRDLGDTMPEEFDRREVDLNRVLAGMGEGMLQLGRAPTMGQALLGAGTGGTAVMAQHEAEQDQLERQAEEARRQHRIMQAESAFAGEQLLNEQEQAAWQAEMGQLEAKVEQDQRRLAEILRRTDVEVGRDGELIVRQPGEDEQGRSTIEVEVIRPAEMQGMLDHFAANLAGEDFEPTIGGRDMSSLWQALGGEARADFLTAAVYTWGMPGDAIPTPEGRQFLEQYRARAREYVEEVKSAALRGTDSEDAVEQVMHTMLMEDMARFPGLRFQLWAGSGNPVLQRLGMRGLQESGFNFETGTFEEDPGLPSEEDINRDRNISVHPAPRGGMQ